jgi:hypothetical protein
VAACWILIAAGCSTAHGAPSAAPGRGPALNVTSPAGPAPASPPDAPASRAPAPPSTPAAPAPAPTLSGIGDPPPASPPAAPAPAEPPVPRVKVTNIGLHIGGGPNDKATKAPFERAIAEKFDDFRRCYAKVGAGGAKGSFGIDLLVARAGGHPATSHSRTAMPGDEFRDCVVHTFETVTFEPPKRGATTLSYALGFAPE